jgi:hypothetical protein
MMDKNKRRIMMMCAGVSLDQYRNKDSPTGFCYVVTNKQNEDLGSSEHLPEAKAKFRSAVARVLVTQADGVFSPLRGEIDRAERELVEAVRKWRDTDDTLDPFEHLPDPLDQDLSSFSVGFDPAEWRVRFRFSNVTGTHVVHLTGQAARILAILLEHQGSKLHPAPVNIDDIPRSGRRDQPGRVPRREN